VLSIKITSSKDGNFLREITVPGRVTIGRDANCDISLPDPEKHISRTHAIIEKQDIGFFLTVISKANPIAVNGTPFHTGITVELKEGDRITLRSYVLDVTEISMSASANQSHSWPNILSNSIDSTPRDPFGLNDLVVKPVTKPEISPDPFGFPTTNKQDAFNGGFAPPPSQVQDLQGILGGRLLDPMAALDSQGGSGYSGMKGNSRVPSISTSSLEDLLSPSNLNQSNISSKANLSASH
jgi:predicted component of type VI protein secretion system